MTTPTSIAAASTTEASTTVASVSERFLGGSDEHQPRQYDESGKKLFHGTTSFPCLSETGCLIFPV